LNYKSPRFYVGSTNNYNKRLSTHIRNLDSGTHHCQPLQRAYRKYGAESFYFLILKTNQDDRLKIEQFIMDSNKLFIYNTCKIAGCPSTKHTKETRQKISNAMKKRIISQETKDKISKQLRGRNRGIEFSLACSTRMKNKPTNIPADKAYRGKNVICIETGIIYQSAAEAARNIMVASNGVVKAIHNNTKSGGYTWKYC